MTLAKVLIAAAVAANLLLLAGLLRTAGRRRPKSAAAAPDIPASVPSQPFITFDQHAAMACGIANETGIDEVALADFDLWTTENGWAKS